MGIPNTDAMLDEAREGVVDPEALIVVTLLNGHDPRMLEDMAVWVEANADLLITHKLVTLVSRLESLDRLESVLKSPELAVLPPKVKAALRIDSNKKKAKHTMPRVAKFAPRSAVATTSRIVHNRLLFGLSARADIITSQEARVSAESVTSLASLICADRSTAWRIVRDLRDCGALDQDGCTFSRVRFPGFFISADTVTNLSALLDATYVSDHRLR
ncbi:MAG: hypothetical protein H7Z43_02595, partial [Clostridia bacterium]|nr:hypothetical protein [Deltaproteobacteria bacterium]